MTHFSVRIAAWSLVALGLWGCATQPKPTTERGENEARPEPPVAAEAPPPPQRVTDRPGNPDGSVIIVEYHKVAKEEARWDRSIDKFRADLERFYDLGLRPVLLTDYLDGEMNLPPGASPVIFTLDDGHVSQFRMLDDGTIDPECIVGIWQEFARDHPDFPVRATFYVLPKLVFGQREWQEQKLAKLKEWGCELGSHTVSHVDLAKVPEAEARRELTESVAMMKAMGFEASTLALPYGKRPKDPATLTDAGFRAALLVGAGPARMPSHPEFDPMSLPRIQGIDGPFGITDWLDRLERGEWEVYVEP